MSQDNQRSEVIRGDVAWMIDRSGGYHIYERGPFVIVGYNERGFVDFRYLDNRRVPGSHCHTSDQTLACGASSSRFQKDNFLTAAHKAIKESEKSNAAKP